MDVYGGFEGGGSSGLIVLLNTEGKILAEEKCEKSTNFLQTGLEECSKIVVDLTNKAKSKCGLDLNTPLKAMGLALSGADSKEDCDRLRRHLQHSTCLSSHYEVCCDTLGSIATVSPNGGIVLIAGTGSSCLLTNPAGDSHRCGGWGHMMGDEGSGFWITQRCMKIYFDHLDNLAICQHDVTRVQKVIFKYFNVQDRFELLDPLYTNFNKKFYAGMCKALADEHNISHDHLIAEVFSEAGAFLARHIVSILPNVHQSLLDNGLDIICTGSVWMAWSLLKPGFMKVISKATTTFHGTTTATTTPATTATTKAALNAATPHGDSYRGLKRLRLLKILRNSTLGAAYIGARSLGVCLDVCHDQNYEVLYEEELALRKL